MVVIVQAPAQTLDYRGRERLRAEMIYNYYPFPSLGRITVNLLLVKLIHIYKTYEVSAVLQVSWQWIRLPPNTGKQSGKLDKFLKMCYVYNLAMNKLLTRHYSVFWLKNCWCILDLQWKWIGTWTRLLLVSLCVILLARNNLVFSVYFQNGSW